MGKTGEPARLTAKSQSSALFSFLAFAALLIALISIMAFKNYSDSLDILERSINERMISTATAAVQVIDIPRFLTYDSVEAMESDPLYAQDLGVLRKLAANLGVKYIYALRLIGDEYRFIYDTDFEDDELFVAYEPDDVHLEAFKGIKAAKAHGTSDIYGSFSTGAVPIVYQGQVVGVMATDIDDVYITAHKNAQFWNMVTLSAVIGITLAVMAFALASLLKKVRRMQDILYRQAHYDKLTGLPNRQYLMEYLEAATASEQKKPFALYFVDLDNFKQVNDTAGHDAGDALLQSISDYMLSVQHNSTVFRPSAGALNVAARIGGDEFILVAPGITASEAEAYAKELIDGLQYKVPDKNITQFNVGFSIGIALYPEHSENLHVLLKYADIAMYHAKNAGKNAFRMYNVEMKGKDEK